VERVSVGLTAGPLALCALSLGVKGGKSVGLGFFSVGFLRFSFLFLFFFFFLGCPLWLWGVRGDDERNGEK
jgi:hypothetical protein